MSEILLTACEMKNPKLISFLICLLFFSVSCSEKEPTRDDKEAGFHSYFPLKIGESSFEAQLAVTEGEMSLGLMGRNSMGESQGMLFVYKQPQHMAFWMKNTPLPLDIGFFSADGVLREIYPMMPFDEKTISSKGDHLLYALEMHQGWFSKHGLKPGDRLDAGLLQTALRARGVCIP